MTTIYQGRRHPSDPYFLIADPAKKHKVKIGDTVICVDPKTNIETKAMAMDRFSFSWEYPMEGLILAYYQIESDLLRKALEQKDEDFIDAEVSLVLMKATN